MKLKKFAKGGQNKPKYNWSTNPNKPKQEIINSENYTFHGSDNQDLDSYLKGTQLLGDVVSFINPLVGRVISAPGDLNDVVKNPKDIKNYITPFIPAVSKNGIAGAKTLSKVDRFNTFLTGATLFSDLPIEEKKNGGKTNPPIITNNPKDPRLQAYNDSLDLYNYYKRVEDLAKANKQQEFRNEVKLTDKKALEASIRLSALNNNRPPSLDMQGESVKFGNTTMTYLKAKKPVQPIIYQPKQEAINPILGGHAFKGSNTAWNGTFKDIRPINQAIQIDNITPNLLPTYQPDNTIETNPFIKGSYFTRPRQPQEEGQGKTDYFDKKTGKLIATYADGGFYERKSKSGRIFKYKSYKI